MFHLIVVGRRVREFLSSNGAKEDLVDLLDNKWVLRACINGLVFSIHEGASNCRIFACGICKIYVISSDNWSKDC